MLRALGNLIVKYFNLLSQLNIARRSFKLLGKPVPFGGQPRAFILPLRPGQPCRQFRLSCLRGSGDVDISSLGTFGLNFKIVQVKGSLDELVATAANFLVARVASG